jgi:YVTN family beta-propeller protein
MKRNSLAAALFAGTTIVGLFPAYAGQAPYDAAARDIPVSSHDRVYTGDQFSNTVSVVDPSDNKTLGVIRLGAPSPANFSPLYKCNCWCTAWASRRIAAPSAWSRSAQTLSRSSTPRPTP